MVYGWEASPWNGGIIARRIGIEGLMIIVGFTWDMVSVQAL